jgi:hypothetical protein
MQARAPPPVHRKTCFTRREYNVLIDQVLADSEVRSRVDELYWEHEVHTSPMIHQGWGAHSWPNETLAYRAMNSSDFTRLRELAGSVHIRGFESITTRVVGNGDYLLS